MPRQREKPLAALGLPFHVKLIEKYRPAGVKMKKKKHERKKGGKKISLMDSPCLHVRELITRVSIYIYIVRISGHVEFHTLPRAGWY